MYKVKLVQDSAGNQSISAQEKIAGYSVNWGEPPRPQLAASESKSIATQSLLEPKVQHTSYTNLIASAVRPKSHWPQSISAQDLQQKTL